MKTHREMETQREMERHRERDRHRKAGQITSVSESSPIYSRMA